MTALTAGGAEATGRLDGAPGAAGWKFARRAGRAYAARMMRAALVVLLVGCNASTDDFPTRGGGPTGIGPVTSGSGGTTGDAGTGDGNDGDAGVTLSGRICIVRDLRKLTTCDTSTRGDASKVTVSIGGRTAAPPAKTGEFSILAPLGTDLVWHASGTNFVTTAMPFGPDNLIPIVDSEDYRVLQVDNQLTVLGEGQGSVVVRAVTGAVAASGVSATTTLVSGNVVPLYDADTSATDWRVLGPTQSSGVMWFPGVQVTTTTPGRITLSRNGGPQVPVTVSVEDQTITFLTQDVP